MSFWENRNHAIGSMDSWSQKVETDEHLWNNGCAPDILEFEHCKNRFETFNEAYFYSAENMIFERKNVKKI